MSYNIYRAGKNLSSDFSNLSGSWTDENPLANNDYILVAIYYDSQTETYRATFSNIYNLQKPLQAQAMSQAANPLDAFWANYDLDLINDDILSETV
jgi:hypothetical protein